MGGWTNKHIHKREREREEGKRERERGGERERHSTNLSSSFNHPKKPRSELVNKRSDTCGLHTQDSISPGSQGARH